MSTSSDKTRDLDADEFRILVDAVGVGKRVGRSLYLHVSALQPCAPRLAAVVAALNEEHGLDGFAFDVVKFSPGEHRLSLLQYPEFMEQGFPRLRLSASIDLVGGQVRTRTYASDANPPVLHRKDLMLAPNHPAVPEFRALSEAAERAGLFDDPAIIGHALQWEEELRARGLAVEGHRLVQATEANADIARFRTALHRTALSTPMQLLERHGYLDGRFSVFDYGCGRGDDVAALERRGLVVHGWDPHFRPEEPRRKADLVNLGFVVNVIEDGDERRAALHGAFDLARRLLVVAALIGGRTAYEKHRLFRDGVLTSIGTFQKYFSQGELGAYLGGVLGREPIAVGPGTYFVFRHDEDEQDFLERRQRRVAQVRRAEGPRRSRYVRPRVRLRSRWTYHAELLERFWQCGLELGRLPEGTEFADVALLREKLGPPARVWRYLLEHRDPALLDAASATRMADLSVYLALAMFAKRQPFGALSERLRHDVRALWGSYATACDAAEQLLRSAGDQEVIRTACTAAAADGLGHLDRVHSLTVHTSLVSALPVALRVYVGCAELLYGDARGADLVKIHMQSAKVSLMTFDDFAGKPIPLLIERVKVDLRRADMRFFEYGDEFEPQPLYLKSRYLPDDFGSYDQQAAFDAALLELAERDLDLDFSGFGPQLVDLEWALDDAGLRIEGYELVPVE